MVKRVVGAKVADEKGLLQSQKAKSCETKDGNGGCQVAYTDYIVGRKRLAMSSPRTYAINVARTSSRPAANAEATGLSQDAIRCYDLVWHLQHWGASLLEGSLLGVHESGLDIHKRLPISAVRQ